MYIHSTRRLQRCFPKSWIQISKDITIFDSVHVVLHCSLIDLSLWTLCSSLVSSSSFQKLTLFSNSSAANAATAVDAESFFNSDPQTSSPMNVLYFAYIHLDNICRLHKYILPYLTTDILTYICTYCSCLLQVLSSSRLRRWSTSVKTSS